MPVTGCKYFISESWPGTHYTAGVVRQDNEQFLEQAGYKKIVFPIADSIVSKWRRLIKAVKLSLSIPGNSLVVFHFPILPSVYWHLHRWLKIRGIKTVAIVIDIDGVRDNDPQLLSKEINRLQQFDHIILHNRQMKKLLEPQLPGKKIYTIGFFDYHAEGQPGPKIKSNEIVIAANLAKSPFIYQLPTLPGQLHFNLYGPGFDVHKLAVGNNNTTYEGMEHPKHLPALLKGSFGLVWDGPSVETCAGNLGAYLRINNPHKSSLYLAAGLPLIVWKQSALATYVETRQIGFTINSLHELEKKITALPVAEYQSMAAKALSLGTQLRRGEHLTRILKAMEQEELYDHAL